MMKLIVKMCHTHLMTMLMQPEKLERSISTYTATTPDVTNEGFNGYVETIVEFQIKSLEDFTKLYQECYVYPTERAKWWSVARGIMLKCGEKNES